MGQTILSGNITNETQQIDVSTLPQGMYFITFAGETRKFVVRDRNNMKKASAAEAFFIKGYP
jgi:hypothetical protein